MRAERSIILNVGQTVIRGTRGSYRDRKKTRKIYVVNLELPSGTPMELTATTAKRLDERIARVLPAVLNNPDHPAWRKKAK